MTAQGRRGPATAVAVAYPGERMSFVYERVVPTRGPEEIAQIVGCRMKDGSCVVHQPREWEARRPGCPYVDALHAYAGYRAMAKPTANRLTGTSLTRRSTAAAAARQRFRSSVTGTNQVP